MTANPQPRRGQHDGCTAWATWGFSAFKETRWYCYEHRMTGKAWKDGAG